VESGTELPAEPAVPVKPVIAKLTVSGTTAALLPILSETHSPMACRCLRILPLMIALVFSDTAPVVAAEERPGEGESWYSIEFEGQRVGYEWVRTTLQPGKRSEAGPAGTPKMLLRERRTLLQLQRSGAKVSLAAVLVTSEAPNGLLQSWELTRTAADGSRIHRRGTWDDSRRAMKIEDLSGTAPTQVFVDAPSQPFSPIFTEWLGQAAAAEDFPRTLPVLFPESAVAAEVEIQSSGKTAIELTGGSRTPARRLLWLPIAAPGLKTRVFLAADSSRCLLVEQPLLGGTLRLIRSSPEAALGLDSQQTLDLQLQSLLPVTGQIPMPIPETGLRLRLTSSSPSPYSIASTDFQTVEFQDSDGIMLICRPPKWEKPGLLLPGESRIQVAAQAEYLVSGRWIDHADPAVQRLSNAAGARSGSTAERCRKLSAFVHRRLQFSAFTTQLQPASRVAAKLQGDCTEHTVLLCALLRDRGIPARAASGFAYVPQLTAFAPHLWTEALVDGVWMPLDSTIPQEAPMPLLLKAADSSLNDDLSGSVSLFAPLLPLCGHVSITVLNAD